MQAFSGCSSPALHTAGSVPLTATRQHWMDTGLQETSDRKNDRFYWTLLDKLHMSRMDFGNIEFILCQFTIQKKQTQMQITLKLFRNSLPSSWSSLMANTMWRMEVPSTCRNSSCGIDCTSRSRFLRTERSEWGQDQDSEHLYESELPTLHPSVLPSPGHLAPWNNSRSHPRSVFYNPEEHRPNRVSNNGRGREAWQLILITMNLCW